MSNGDSASVARSHGTAPQPGAAQAVDLWFDPICPWAWLTSRWLVEVAAQRPLHITWHIFSLAVLNEGREVPAEYEELMRTSWWPGRVVVAAAADHGDVVVPALYTAIGTRLHPGGEPLTMELIGAALADAGLPASLLDQAGNATHDTVLRTSTREAIALVGDDVGTPVIATQGVAFFGPVISPAPTGEAAVALWEGVLGCAHYPGFFELKRSRTVGPIFTTVG